VHAPAQPAAVVGAAPAADAPQAVPMAVQQESVAVLA